MISTLIVTIIVEGVVVIGYSIWRKKPVYSLFFTTVFGNLITQSLLWVVLYIFFQQYLITLLIAEILIWIMESVLLYSIRSNQLRFTEAILLSLGINMTSFALGLFLPF